ncbi:MAG: hypothetical protein M8858_08190 [marine benthic group bacterium]|nr:hypothetical protein [Gemmatimonadota bacterium]
MGTTLKGIVDKAPAGTVPLGFCTACDEAYTASMKEFGKSYNGAGRVAGKAPDLEAPELTPELQQEFGFTQEPEGDYGYTEERERYP